MIFPGLAVRRDGAPQFYTIAHERHAVLSIRGDVCRGKFDKKIKRKSRKVGVGEAILNG
jgi:hypothetical protein